MKANKKQEYFSLAIIRWLVHRVKLDNTLPLRLKGLVQKIFLIHRTRGPSEAILYCKQRRAFLFGLLSRNRTLDLSSDLQDFPKDLKFLRNYKTLEVPLIKLLLTVFSISRIFRTRAVPSFETIRGPSEMKAYPFRSKDFKLFWKHLGYSRKLKSSRVLDFKHFHKTSKAGPNGQALWYCLSDLISIPQELLLNIITLGGKKLERYIVLTLKYLPFLKQGPFPISEGQIRKLICFPDREGKTREVAILDYYSQSSLIPLHKYLFKALKKIPQDFTFDQTGYKSSLSSSKVFYSIDLTAFTDRFPIRVNRDLLSSRIGPEKADAWVKIMTHEFSSQYGNISYSVGNPMGAYSSWNSTTLSHHFVVWKACQNKGHDWKTLPYAMLGDDLVIGHREVALEYCRLIRLLGVHWSKEKTHVSEHFFEFAKRYHWNGHDVSPFPIAGLWSERNRIIGQIQVLDNAISKEWFSASECQESLDELFSQQGFPRRLRSKWISSMIKSWSIISVLQKKTSALELLPFVEKISPVVASKLNEEKIFNILTSSIMLSFVDSSESIRDTKKHKDTLGQFAENFTLFLTSLMLHEGFEDSVNLPESIPQTHVWGVISEDYLRSQREAFIIDTIRGGDWDPLLKNLKIPTSDSSVYLGRKMDLLYLHSTEIVRKFEDNILQLAAFPQLI